MWKPAGALAVTVAGMLVASGPASAAAETFDDVPRRIVAEHRLVPGVAAAVDAPAHDVGWEGAAGRLAHLSGPPLTPADPFRIASVTKPFVAAAILRLAEDGHLRLDDRIGRHLPAHIVQRIHRPGWDAEGGRITLRQLLNHTSGIASHDEDPQFQAALVTQPRRRWTPREQIDVAARMGPRFRPGAPGRWSYSDTGFVLLGLVITRTTGQDLGTSLRDLLGFDRLGMTSTWHELLEPDRAAPRPLAHQYFNLYDFSGHDPSFDSWGGGGLVSTSADLNRFARALFAGEVFRGPESLAEMLTTVPVGDRGFAYARNYGLGLGRWEFADTVCWGHPGVWSSAMFFCPSLDAAVSGTTNQMSDEHGEHTEGHLVGGLLEVLRGLPRLRPPSLTLRVRPSRAVVRRRVRYVLRVTRAGEPLAGVRIGFARRSLLTDARGVAQAVVRFRRPGGKAAVACTDELGCTTARVRVVRRRS